MRGATSGARRIHDRSGEERTSPPRENTVRVAEEQDVLAEQPERREEEASQNQPPTADPNDRQEDVAEVELFTPTQ